MTKKKTQKWICARCERRKEVKAEADPVVLRECDWCHIKNWTRPVGHGGANAGEGRVMAKKVDADGERLPIYKKGEVAETIPVLEEVVDEALEKVIEEAEKGVDVSLDSSTEEILEKVEAETVPDEPERVLGNFVKLDVENVTDDLDAQIAALEAKKAELEK